MKFQIQGYAVPGTTVYYKNNIAISFTRETPNTKLESQLLYQVMEIWSWKIRNQLFFKVWSSKYEVFDRYTSYIMVK